MSRSRVWVVLLAAFAAALVVAAPASAASNKPYSLVICALGTSESCSPSPTSAANAPAGVPAAGGTVVMTATFKNENKAGSGINLGSANLTPPTGFTVSLGANPLSGPGTATVDSTGTVDLRSLGLVPGASETLTMTVQAPAQSAGCSGANGVAAAGTVASPCTWSVVSKQSNDFSGSPGNNLTVDTGTSTLNTVFMSLGFTSEPADELLMDPVTGLPDPITNSDYNPAGGPVTVSTVDANGHVVASYVGPVSLAVNTPLNSNLNPNPASLSGDTPPIDAVGGVATFSDLVVSEPGNGYTLTASTSDTPPLSASSTMFDAQDAGTQCASKHSCQTKLNSANFTTTNGGVSTTIIAGTGTTTDLAESLDFGTHLSAAQCENYDAAHDVYWNVDPNSGRIVQVAITTTVLSGTISGSLINGQDSCLSSPTDFLEINDTVTPNVLQNAPAGPQPDGTMGFSGLLPDCGTKKLQVSPATNPCVVSRTGTSNPLGGGTLTITISVPAILGDMTSRG